MPTGMGDQELLAAYAGRGDQGAFAALVARHAPLVHAACRRRLGDADADDAAQAVFLLVARHAAVLARDPRSLAPWLFTTAGLVARNHQRIAGRRREREQRMIASTPTPESELELWPDVRVHLDAALDDLPETYRTPLVLHYLEGRERVELGPALGLSAEALKKRMSRGVELLRSALARRGVAVPAGGLVALLAQAQAEAAEGAAQACSATAAVVAGTAPPAAIALAAGAPIMPMLTTALAATVLAIGGGWAIVTAFDDPPAPAPAPAPMPPRLNVGMNASFWYLSLVEWQYAPDQGTSLLPEDLLPHRRHTAYFCHAAGSDHLNKDGEPLPVRVIPWMAIEGDGALGPGGETTAMLAVDRDTVLAYQDRADLAAIAISGEGVTLHVGSERITVAQRGGAAGWTDSGYRLLPFWGITDFIQPQPVDIARTGKVVLADGGTVVWEPAVAGGRGQLVYDLPVSRRVAGVLLPGHAIQDGEGLRTVREAETLDIAIEGRVHAEIAGDGAGGQSGAQSVGRLFLTMTRADGTVAYRGRLGVSTTALPLPGVVDGTLAAIPDLSRALAQPAVRAQVATWAANQRLPISRISRRLQDMVERPPILRRR